MTAYSLYVDGKHVMIFADEQRLARYILHNQRILRDEYQIMPKPEAVRLEVKENAT